MSAKSLGRHYDALTPWEQLPLLVAAAARGDAQELGRLRRSAPLVAYRAADYLGALEALEEVCTAYLLRQLDLAALYWQASGLLAEHDALTLGEEDKGELGARLLGSVRLVAYLLCVHAAAFCRLCRRLAVAPAAVLKGMAGLGTVRDALRASAWRSAGPRRSSTTRRVALAAGGSLQSSGPWRGCAAYCGGGDSAGSEPRPEGPAVSFGSRRHYPIREGAS
jgi:hypothetical protein